MFIINFSLIKTNSFLQIKIYYCSKYIKSTELNIELLQNSKINYSVLNYVTLYFIFIVSSLPQITPTNRDE